MPHTPPEKPAARNHDRPVSAVWVLALYVFTYLLVRRNIGSITAALGLFPLAYISWLWGPWGGSVAGLLLHPLHLALNLGLQVRFSPDLDDLIAGVILTMVGSATGWVGTLHRRLREQAASLRESETRLRTIFNQLPALLWTTDDHLVITSGMGARPTSDGGARESQTAVVGRSIYDLFNTRDPAYPPIAAHLGALQGNPGTYMNELHDHYFEGHVEPFHDGDGQIVGTIGIALDITARRKSEEALRRSEERLSDLADNDVLTGLHNRWRFQEELDGRLASAQASSSTLALLFLDVDGFKHVNDSLGHQAGDDLLKHMAGLLQHQVRPESDAFVARLGGDEFAVILPGSNMGEACALSEKIVQATRKHIAVVHGQPIVATVSIGIAIYPLHGMTADTLQAHADLAMYQTKESGRNGYSVYQPERGQRTESEQKLAWEARIRRTLDEDRFVLYAQPIHTLAGGGVAHYELLLRMIGEDGELILPGAFLEVAEKFGLIREIDRWVVTRALELGGALRRLGASPRLAVNLSGKAFTDAELLPLILRHLDRTGADPERLVLEITETALITDMAQAGDWVQALRKVGCKFAIDDFGSGFSSFSHLRRLSFDYLKIDGSYINDLPTDEANQHLVRSMVEIARGLGMQTIAEHVSDESTVRLVRACGVDYGQGFFLGRPAPLEHWWPELNRARMITLRDRYSSPPP